MTVRADLCTHKTLRRVGDHDSGLVYLFCYDCRRCLGVYDPRKAGSLQLARVA